MCVCVCERERERINPFERERESINPQVSTLLLAPSVSTLLFLARGPPMINPTPSHKLPPHELSQAQT